MSQRFKIDKYGLECLRKLNTESSNVECLKIDWIERCQAVKSSVSLEVTAGKLKWVPTVISSTEKFDRMRRVKSR